MVTINWINDTLETFAFYFFFFYNTHTTPYSIFTVSYSQELHQYVVLSKSSMTSTKLKEKQNRKTSKVVMSLSKSRMIVSFQNLYNLISLI